MAKTEEVRQEHAKLCVACQMACKQSAWAKMHYCPKYVPEDKK